MRRQSGFVFGTLAYLTWGGFPFYFGLLTSVNAFEIIPWRVISCVVACAAVLTAARGWGPVSAVLRSPRKASLFFASGVLLYVNWQVFVYGVVTGRVLETALGYFITPLLTILLGVVCWRERLRPLQWLAVAVAAVGVAISAVAYGEFPVVALGVAVSFGLYGAVRKVAATRVNALQGLTLESLAVVPLAVVQFAIVAGTAGTVTALGQGPAVLWLVLMSGAVTAIPLLLFSAAARRLPLSYLGFLQFLAPILNFLYGTLVNHEPINAVRLLGFSAVWLAVLLLVSDTACALVRRRRSGVDRTPPIH